MNKLHLSGAAQEDLAGIKAYIAQELDSPQAALSTLRRITKSIRILRDHAYAGAALSSVTDTKSEVRFLVSGQYLIFYRVCGRDVYVDRVLYGRRDYLRALFGDALPAQPDE